MTRRPDDFPIAVQRRLANDAGLRCSLCQRFTGAPKDGSGARAGVGTAAHITAAEANGPRHDPKLTPEERRSEANGIWLCANHGRLIDVEANGYPTPTLLATKAGHVEYIAELTRSAGAPLAPDAHATLRRLAEESLHWPRTLGAGHRLPVDEASQLADLLRDEEPRVVALLGPPGIGKSALLAEVGSELTNRGTLVLAVRCDRLSDAVTTDAELSTALGLTVPFAHAIACAAIGRSCVLIVDQLDALCDITDVHTDRLRLVLDAVHELRGLPRLRVVFGCRSFEFTHDARLRALEPTTVTLGAPTWDSVATVLGKQGVGADGFPDALREHLRVPQHLKVFLATGVADRGDLTSYQSMLEVLWRRHVAVDRTRVRLIERIVDYANEHEVLSVPSALADEDEPAFVALQAAGVLRTVNGGLGIAFSHQTLQEFARARAFASRSLADHVVGRQGSIFVRPTLWSGLTYLRAAARERYLVEFAALWERPDGELRRHIRALLLDFLGQVPDPAADEIVWIVDALRRTEWPAWALRAVAGNRAWFEILDARSVFSRALQTQQVAGVGLCLWRALAFAQNRVLALVEQTLRRGQNWELALGILQQLTDWSAPALEVATQLVRNNPNARAMDLYLLFVRVAEADPGAAARLVAHALEAGFDELRGDDRADALGRLIRRAGELGDLPGWAEAAPRMVRNALFPVFRRLAEAEREDDAERGSYRRSAMLELYLDTSSPRDALVDAARIAMECTAAEDPDEWLAFAQRFADSSAGVVHGVLARGFAALPKAQVSYAVEYLLGDDRRFAIAGVGDSITGTTSLLRAIAPQIDAADVHRLEAAILRLKVRDETDGDASLRWHCQRANRSYRLRLLRCLPEQHLSATTRAQMEQEVRVFRNPDEPDSSLSNFGEIGSPVRSDQMLKARDEHVLSLFDELTDQTEFQHPKRFMSGGAVQAAREFGEFAKEAPGRAAEIIKKLRPVEQELPAAHGLEALIQANVPGADTLVLECDARGFTSEDFRFHVTWALRARAAAGHLPVEALVDVLRRWADEAPPATETSPRDPKGSLLGRGFGGGILPRGAYPALSALAAIFLRSDPPRIDAWLDVLERRLEHGESLAVWEAVAHDLDVLFSERVGGATFVTRLADTSPEFLTTPSGAHLIVRHRSRFHPQACNGWIQRLRGGADGAQRAAGELLFAFSLSEAHGWAAQELNILRATVTGPIHIGAAYAAAVAWAQEELRDAATRWIISRVSFAQADELAALLSMFESPVELAPDPDTLDLMRCIAARDEALRLLEPNALEAVGGLLPDGAQEAATLVGRFLDVTTADGINVPGRVGFAGAALVEISIALQHTRDARTLGIDLFERLLELGIHGVSEALFDIDGRPLAAAPPRVPRRPRSGRRSSRGPRRGPAPTE